MTIKPILFSGPMVRALLAGEKTQTRRVLTRLKGYGKISCLCKPDFPWFDWEFRDQNKQARGCNESELRELLPYEPGDRLWVRETVACGACAPSKPPQWSPGFWRREQGSPQNTAGLWYQADDLAPANPITERGKWTPARFMPRWASRMVLNVTDVRVQRLQDITDDDALAEGVACAVAPGAGRDVDIDGQYWPGGPKRMFRELWDSLNKKRGCGWQKNFYVVAVTFAVHHGNVDLMTAKPGSTA